MDKKRLLYKVVCCPLCGMWLVTTAKILKCKYCGKSRKIKQVNEFGLSVKCKAILSNGSDAAKVAAKMNAKGFFL